MLSDTTYYDQYMIQITTNFTITDFPQFMSDNEQYLLKLKTTWKFYSAFLNIASTIKAHPKYSPTGKGSNQKLYLDGSFTPNTSISTFNSIKPDLLYRYCYNIIALQNFNKLNLLQYAPKLQTAFNDNSHDLLVSDSNNTLFDNLQNYIPLYVRNLNTLVAGQVTLQYPSIKTFQKLTKKESLFVQFITQVLNYFLSLATYDNDSLLISFDRNIPHEDKSLLITYDQNINVAGLSITAQQISHIYYKLFNKNPRNIPQLVVDLTLIGDYILPYIYKFNEIFPTLEIPKYFLGVTVYDFLIWNKLDLLFQINAYENICPTINPITNQKSPIFNISN